MVPIIILGGIYGGFMTPTEAAAVAAFYGLIVGRLLGGINTPMAPAEATIAAENFWS